MKTPTVTAAEIARLAGVGRAAVSNWRKRHPDFPAPVGGTTASPEFDLMEVEQWLRGQGKLPELSRVDRLWQHLAVSEEAPASALATVGAVLLARQRGERPVLDRADAEMAALLPDIDALVDEMGPQATFDELWRRFSAPGPGRPFATPDELADLMAELAGVAGGSVLDPAAGSGATLRAAVRAGCNSAYGQELDRDLARLAGIWLALRGVPGEVCPGDSLRADAFADRTVDAVVCHPPFGATNWGDEELGHDPRWIVGSTPRTEPELAWVQHALARLRIGGHAVLLMPPTVAGRRAGKRIRHELLRRGHLRAVIALPAGAAPPHGVPLHVWVLRRAAVDAPAPARVLLVDAAGEDLAVAFPRVLATWRRFAEAPDAEIEEAGFARTVPVIELLDEEVDLTPARRQSAAEAEPAGQHLARTRKRLAAVIGDLPKMMPQVAPAPDQATAPLTLSIAELARTGALQLIGPIRLLSGQDESRLAEEPVGGLVLTGLDVIEGRGASGQEERLAERVPLMSGDVVVPAAARHLIARVIPSNGLLLGANLYLLRPNPAALDSWFLAGQLRSSANDKQTTSLARTRIDIRRAQVRRLPLDEQQAYGDTFQRLSAFESAFKDVGSLAAELVRLTADGLVAGTLRPDTRAK
ncbi:MULTISPECIES: N-6 DNA methylase [unclassified Micromonospora]|uniref:N-6 DNA methylase n=1 Tax=unclassified Micromonospora TaxID=2617518 RepID=UPI0033275C3E